MSNGPDFLVYSIFFFFIILTLYILVARLPSASPLVDLQYIYLKLNYLCQWWLCWSAGTRASSSSYSAFSLKSFLSIDFESIQRLKERTREPFNVRLFISDKVFNFQLVFFFLFKKTDSFVNSQEWTLSRAVPDLRLGIVGSLASGKSALVHRYLTGSYMQEESPEGGRFKKEISIDGQSYLLLIRDEGGSPELQVSLHP